MNLQLGIGQEVNIHEVESVKIEETTKLDSINPHNKYFRTMHIKTVSGETIEITLFSKDKSVLEYNN
jgi:hypothetical protein